MTDWESKKKSIYLTRPCELSLYHAPSTTKNQTTSSTSMCSLRKMQRGVCKDPKSTFRHSISSVCRTVRRLRLRWVTWALEPFLSFGSLPTLSSPWLRKGRLMKCSRCRLSMVSTLLFRYQPSRSSVWQAQPSYSPNLSYCQTSSSLKSRTSFGRCKNQLWPSKESSLWTRAVSSSVSLIHWCTSGKFCLLLTHSWVCSSLVQAYLHSLCSIGPYPWWG